MTENVVLTRKNATALGKTHYFTGRPCPKGHISERRVKDRKCVQCSREYTEAYRERFPEKTQAYLERWREENKERRIAYKGQWNDKNKEHCKAYHKTRRIEKREYICFINRRRHARKKNAQGSHTLEETNTLLRMQKWRCACCGASIKRHEQRHLDHIMPLSRGGSDARANLQWLCGPCNLRKSDKMPDQWAREIGRLI